VKFKLGVVKPKQFVVESIRIWQKLKPYFSHRREKSKHHFKAAKVTNQPKHYKPMVSPAALLAGEVFRQLVPKLEFRLYLVGLIWGDLLFKKI